MNVTCGHGTSLVPSAIIKFLHRRSISTRASFNVNKPLQRANGNLKRAPKTTPSDTEPAPFSDSKYLQSPTPLSPASIVTTAYHPPPSQPKTKPSKQHTAHKTTNPSVPASSPTSTPVPPLPPTLPDYATYRITHPFLSAQSNFETSDKCDDPEARFAAERERNKKVKVFLGVSGGVDSSVSALLLQRQGFDVVGVYMKCWDGRDEVGACQGEKDLQDAKAVCDFLKIPFKEVDFVKEYWQEVFTDFLAGYESGITPNPDVLCNRKIKFNHFLNYCLNNGADLVATGHYATLEYADNGDAKLKRAVDRSKDQSYFLSSVSSKQLERVIFPVGNITKAQVRAFAEQASLSTAQKKNSVGLCFVGKRTMPEFLSQYIDGKHGRYKTLEGKDLGPIKGINFLTIGQRPRLPGHHERLFICGIDYTTNTVTLCYGIQHPALYSDSCIVRNVVWINGPPAAIENGETLECLCQARYHQKIAPCKVTKRGEVLDVVFDSPHKVPVAGQAFVMYKGDVCLGSGIVHESGPSYFNMKKDLPEGFLGDADE